MRRKAPSRFKNKKRPLLSLGIIARDAGDVIQKPIESTRGFVDEVVLVDTGSRDNTKQKAQELGAKVFDLPWSHDFGKARTFALKKCSGKFHLWMDADEAFQVEGSEEVRPLLEGAEYQIIFCKNFVDETYQVPEYDLEGFGQGATIDKPRIFINHPSVSFQHRVHEAPAFPQADTVKQVAYTDLTVLHQGTMTQDKADYYQALLWLEKKDHPRHPHANMYLATYAILKSEYERGLKFLDEVDQELLGPQDTGVGKRFHYLYGQAHQGMGSLATVQGDRDDHYVKALTHYSAAHSSMARLQAAVIHIQLHRYETARKILQESLQADPAHLLLQQLVQVVERWDGQELERKLSDFFVELSQQKDPVGALQAITLDKSPQDLALPAVPQDAVDRAVKGRGLKLKKALDFNAIRERLNHGKEEEQAAG
jgi:tetratricopeptide (TPR) repeat protein